MIQRKRCALALVLAFAALCGAAEDGPAKSPNYATFTLVDGSTVSGDLLDFADGHFRLKTPRGALMIRADRVAKINPIDALPAKPTRLDVKPGHRPSGGLLSLMVMNFRKGFDRDPFTTNYEKKFRNIAGITKLCVRYGDRRKPLQILDEVGRAKLAKTGERHCVLVACRAIAYGLLGEKTKAKETAESLPTYGIGLEVREQLARFSERMKAAREGKRR